MKRLLLLVILVLITLPTGADASTVRVRPGAWNGTSTLNPFMMPVQMAADRPDMAIVPHAQWRPLAVCLLSQAADPSARSEAEATVRCARIQALSLEQARRSGQHLTPESAQWLRWHKTGELEEIVLASLDEEHAPEVALAD